MSPVKHRLVSGIEPMYASVGHTVPTGANWTFEPKYDGVRVLAHVAARGTRLITRNGNDKAPQFPEIIHALAQLAVRLGRPFTIDGEVVALIDGKAARFQTLQSRMHLKSNSDITIAAEHIPSALVAFDILSDNRVDLTGLPWIERHEHLALLLHDVPTTKRGRATNFVARHIRLAPSRRDGAAMLTRARKEGWEGIIAKRTDACYSPGVRSDAWLKLKIDFEQEFVVGGFTEPRKTRKDLGALLLGYFDARHKLIYVGHTGGGFTRTGLKAMRQRLDRFVRKTSPFEIEPHTNEPATWVRPTVVVQVKFSEWTANGRLRQPIFLGVRDDKSAKDVGYEAASVQRKIEV